MVLKIGFIGLGNMGKPMVLNFLKDNVEVHVYNRTTSKAQDLTAQGAKQALSPKDLYKDVSIVFSIVTNDLALEEIVSGSGGLLETIKPGDIHVSMSTVSPKITAELAELHRQKEAFYIASPVFGRPDAAEQKKIRFCIAGDEIAKANVHPYLSMLSEKVYDFGTNPSDAIAVKLAGNFMILSAVETLAEGLAFVKKHHIDEKKFISFITETLFPSPVYEKYGHIITSRQFQPSGFKLQLGHKDITLILEESERIHVQLPIAWLLHDLLLIGIAIGRQDYDWSAIALTALEESDT